MRTEIDVETDPASAFRVFTEEYDQWWGNSPIGSYRSWRFVERRIEPGVGGRLLEDYGDEENVLGTITVWEPGACLAWTTRDGVTIEVTFSAQVNGTRVTVTGVVPDGVDGTADLSMLRMAPKAFPRYLQRRHLESPPRTLGRLHIALRSAAPTATARWLAAVLQLEPVSDIPDAEGDPDHTWIEFRVGDGLIVLWGGGGPVGTTTPIVYVDDLDAHLEHAEAAGAKVITPIVENGYRAYTVQDCEGRHWQFAQAGPRIGH
jgi:catechol 2,3-dioxygenase-like lactoylglutathione lyase family enzyme